MKININDQFKVVLTAFGAKHYNDYMLQFRCHYCKQAGSVIIGTMWDLMSIFGSVMYNGMFEVPFIDNEMELV